MNAGCPVSACQSFGEDVDLNYGITGSRKHLLIFLTCLNVIRIFWELASIRVKLDTTHLSVNNTVLMGQRKDYS